MDGQPFYAHANLISRHSKPLEALMKNPMKEKEQGYAVLGEVTPDTFDRFLQWIYQGFYTASQPKIVEASSPTLPDTSTTEKTNETEIEGSVNEFPSEAIEVVDTREPINEPLYGWGSFGSLSTKKKARRLVKRRIYFPCYLQGRPE